ncbi:patatin-like phospholipase family protein [Demequina capsici]|uniref:Patatin-like phospholipase family protein n=1 Tax=Demequina capsici TaxID=3075620 RepID=A0AA96F4U1_9MICO|nr:MULTISPECIES: patatin-like phospholipase family protein [unclassified Demequina]WNM23842.1 patatin-like phospholipase family protein [Demequina sp. OYTSA14]WNM26681.1 patatin-like phospholipase family protein [Demequina sp. PMTSA13]
MEDRTDLRYAPLLGLALGGGGALGAAHVGVLQVLHERGIRPELVVGTSAGAVIGAAYAAGIDPYELETMVVDARWGDFGTFSFMPGLGVLDTEGLRRTIEQVAGGDLRIEDLPLTFGAVATDVSTGGAVLLSHGSLADAISASIAVPGLFRPQRLKGHLLVDGGVVQNLPLQAAFETGASDVIGVRLAAEWDALPRYRTSTQVHELEIDSRVTMVRPQIGQRSQWVARDIPGLIELGREAAEQALAEYDVVSPRPRDPADKAVARAAAEVIRHGSAGPLEAARAHVDSARAHADRVLAAGASDAASMLRRRDRRTPTLS